MFEALTIAREFIVAVRPLVEQIELREGAVLGCVSTVAQALRGAGLGPAQGATLRWLMDGANPLRRGGMVR